VKVDLPHEKTPQTQKSAHMHEVKSAGGKELRAIALQPQPRLILKMLTSQSLHQRARKSQWCPESAPQHS
jgi:hypothetical protein